MSFGYYEFLFDFQLSCLFTSSKCSESSTSASPTPRKRKCEADDDHSNFGRLNGKKLKTSEAKSEGMNLIEVKRGKQSTIEKVTDDGYESLRLEDTDQQKMRRNYGINKRKAIPTKKLRKASGVKKTRPLRNIRVTKKILDDSREIKKSTVSGNVVEAVDDDEVQKKRRNGQLIKSKILSHLNNKLGKCQRQLKGVTSKAEAKEDQQQATSTPKMGTLTLSDLISREFELVCNGSAKQTLPVTLKFDNLKVGFVSPTMFQLRPSSSPILPQFLKLEGSNNEAKLVISSDSLETSDRQNHVAPPSTSAGIDKDSKKFHCNAFATNTDSPLAEYFPLLSNSLKNSNKPVEPTIVQLKAMSSKRRAPNCVERETLLCLANKLSQKLFGKLNTATSISSGMNSPSTTNPRASELPRTEWSQMVSNSEHVLSSGTNSNLKWSPQKQISNFNFLKNILLSISSKSASIPNLSQALETSSSLNCGSTSTLTSPDLVSTRVSFIPLASAQRPGSSATIIANDLSKDNFNRGMNASGVTALPSPSGSLASSASHESLYGDFNGKASLLPSPVSSSPSPQLTSKLPLPVVQSNILEQKNRFLNKPVEQGHTISQGMIFNSLPTTQNINRATMNLQLRALTRDTVQPAIPSNPSLQHARVISSKLQSSTLSSPSVRVQSNLFKTTLPGPSGVNLNLNDALLRNLIFTDKSLGRIPQDGLAQASLSQRPLVHGERLIQLNSSSSNMFANSYINNNNNNNNNSTNNNNITSGHDTVKMGKTSLQIPMNSLMSTLRLQSPVPIPQGNQITTYPAPNNSAITGTNGSSPLIIFSPVNQQLNLGSYLAVNNIPTDNTLNRPAIKKAELSPNNILQVNQVLVPPPNYLPMLNIPQGSLVSPISPTISKSQIVLYQNPPRAVSVGSKSLAMTSEPSCNSNLKNVTFIPIINTSANNNQMFLWLPPANKK